MADARIVIVGTGSLASSVCHALVDALTVPAQVVVVTGSLPRGRALSYSANVRATLSCAPVRFRPEVCDLTSERALERLHGDVRPDLVLNCASLHSPRDEAQTPTGWTVRVRRAGFALTLPLQAIHAIAIGRSLAGAAPDAVFMNACFPDLVNPLLRSLGVPVLCGIGNANLVAAVLQDALGLSDQCGLRLLAHHRHLYAQDDPLLDARGWLDGCPIADIGDRLAPLRGLDRTARNPVSGRAAAQLIDHVVTGRPLRTSVPGPLGLPGGYPVRIEGRRLELDLPPDVDAASAVEWNRQQCLLDGAEVLDGGEVRLSSAVACELERELPAVAAGFHASRTREVCEQIVELRHRWRTA